MENLRRALDNFGISGLTIDPEFINSLVEVKMAAAEADAELELLEKDKADAILRAAREILEGKFPAEFPLDVCFRRGQGPPGT